MFSIKHIFIVNPAAGKNGAAKALLPEISRWFAQEHTLVYETTAPMDAARYVREICEQFPDTPLRFYACGGDGTLHEVVNGALGHAHASVTAIPCGTGNDFVRNFLHHDHFHSLEAMQNVTTYRIDLIRCAEQVAINACNLGFDAEVAHNMNRFKRFPLVSGTAAYLLSIIYCFAGRIAHDLEITFDRTERMRGKFLLCVAGNGRTYGSGFAGVPKARIDDGLLDVCLVRRMPRRRFVTLVGKYKDGRHLDDKKYADVIVYRKCERISFRGTSPVRVCVDGECFSTLEADFEVLPGALRFFAPENCVPSMPAEPLLHTV